MNVWTKCRRCTCLFVKYMRIVWKYYDVSQYFQNIANIRYKCGHCYRFHPKENTAQGKCQDWFKFWIFAGYSRENHAGKKIIFKSLKIEDKYSININIVKLFLNFFYYIFIPNLSMFLQHIHTFAILWKCHGIIAQISLSNS